MGRPQKNKPPRFSIQLGWGGLVATTVVLVLVMAWIFVLGVLVGRGVIPNPLESSFLEKLGWKKSSSPPPQAAAPTPEASEETTEMDLNFYHALEGKRKVVKGVVPREPDKRKRTAKLYTVQIASFKDGTKAQVFLQQMKDKKIECYISPAKSKGVIWYRIRSGRFENLDSARAFVRELEDQHGLKPLVVSIP